MSKRLLLIDDDQAFCDVTLTAMRRRRWDCEACTNIEAAMVELAQQEYSHILLDMRIGQDSGLQYIEKIRLLQPRAKLVVVTGYASVKTAVDAIKLGADDYLAKPLGLGDLLGALMDGQMAAEDNAEAPGAIPSVGRLEWEHIQRVLAQNQGNISATARALGMHRRTLQRKLAKRPTQN